LVLRVWRYLWPLPATLLGVLFALLARCSGGMTQRVEGVLEVSGGWSGKILHRGFPVSGSVMAITLGHVVLGVSLPALESTRAHERAHVRQFERWGALLLVLYPLVGLLVWLRGGHPYRDNPFEIEARAAESGAVECRCADRSV
jgi:hypothetical protein